MEGIRIGSVTVRHLTAAVAALVALAACATRAEAPAHEPASRPSAALPSGWKTCENHVYGYVVGHPGSWFTTDILNGQQDASYACLWFSPEPFDQVDEQGRPLGNVVLDGFGYPVEIFVRDLHLSDAVGDWTDPERVRVVSRQDTTVDGRTAVSLEVRTLDDPIAEPGLHYLYVIELGGARSMFVHTTATRGIAGDYEENKQILDQAVQTLRFVEPTEPAA